MGRCWSASHGCRRARSLASTPPSSSSLTSSPLAGGPRSSREGLIPFSNLSLIGALARFDTFVPPTALITLSLSSLKGTLTTYINMYIIISITRRNLFIYFELDKAGYCCSILGFDCLWPGISCVGC